MGAHGANGDTVDYSQNSTGVEVDLSVTTNQVKEGSVFTDTLLNIENVIGTGSDDVLTGDNQVNTLTGGDRDDTLKGNDGDDVLNGGNDNDILNGWCRC